MQEKTLSPEKTLKNNNKSALKSTDTIENSVEGKKTIKNFVKNVLAPAQPLGGMVSRAEIEAQLPQTIFMSQNPATRLK